MDDYQPRKWCKLLYEAGKIGPQNTTEINKFSTNYFMKKALVVDHLQLLTDLKLKRDLRKNWRAVIKLPEPTTDNDSISDSKEDTQTDVILNVIQGSDSESDENDHITVVPELWRSLVKAPNGQGIQGF